jgi:4'-phosphopantetheinyl transferase EntD
LEISTDFVQNSPLCRDILGVKKNEKSFRQSLAARLLLSLILKKFDIPEQNFIYPNGRKPFLPADDLSFCFSHSKNFVIAALSFEKIIGTDIEVIQSGIEKILPRIATEQEMSFCRNEIHFAKLWTAKEAAYKCLNEKNVFWKEEIKTDVPNEKVYFRGKEMQLHHEIFFDEIAAAFCTAEK